MCCALLLQRSPLPVSILWSTEPQPDSTTPSQATRSPGRTKMRSPTTTCPTGTAMPLSASTAVSGCKVSNAATALLAWLIHLQARCERQVDPPTGQNVWYNQAGAGLGTGMAWIATGTGVGTSLTAPCPQAQVWHRCEDGASKMQLATWTTSHTAPLGFTRRIHDHIAVIAAGIAAVLISSHLCSNHWAKEKRKTMMAGSTKSCRARAPVRHKFDTGRMKQPATGPRH